MEIQVFPCSIADIINVDRSITIHYSLKVLPFQVPVWRGVVKDIMISKVRSAMCKWGQNYGDVSQ